jgi:subtilisin family serine protease
MRKLRITESFAWIAVALCAAPAFAEVAVVVELPEVQSAAESASFQVAATSKGLSHSRVGRYAVLSGDTMAKGKVGISSDSDQARSWQLCESLIRDGLAEAGYCEPVFRYRASVVPNDPMFSDTWGLSKVQAPAAWERTTGNQSVRVAIIDTGIDYNHPDLVGNVARESGYDFINEDSDAMDDNGHGTHCAGTVGASGNNGVGVTGMAWKVTLIPEKALAADGSGTNAQIAAAVDHAVAQGAHIISMSLGGENESPTLKRAMLRGSEAGVLFVVAAGNESLNNDTSPNRSYPASSEIPNMLAVAATDVDDQLASFSNFGTTKTHISAPGVDIWSTIPGGGYDSYSGTSMATPLVAGVAALLKGLNLDFSATQIKEMLLNSSDSIAGLQSVVAGGRRVNANNAVALALGTTPLPPETTPDLPNDPEDPGSDTPIDEYSLYVDKKALNVKNRKVRIEAYAVDSSDDESVYTGITIYASCYDKSEQLVFSGEAVTSEDDDGAATIVGKLSMKVPKQLPAAKRFLKKQKVTCWLETDDSVVSDTFRLNLK